MDALLRDLRHGIRLLGRRTGFSALAIGMLAVAIGANTAIFSAVEGVLLRPPAFQQPQQLVMVWERNAEGGRDRNVTSPYNFSHWRERSRSFTDAAAFLKWRANLTAPGQPERLDVAFATGNLFAVLGVKPMLGRALAVEDSRPGAPDVTVLGEAFWRRRFNADPSVVGRSVTIDGDPTTVVGVMPQSFQVPAGVAVWLPYPLDPAALDPNSPEGRGRFLSVVARLRPEVTLAQARDEMSRIAAQLTRENPARNAGWASSVYPLHADLVRSVRPALMVLMGAVGLLLMIACANVANLLLARAAGRQREMAIRAALGAGRGQLMRQLLTESVMLGLAGGAAGVLIAVWGLKGLVALMPVEIRLLSNVQLDGTVLAFTAAVSVLSAIVFGLVPALQQSRLSLVPALKEGGAVRGGGQSQRRLKNALVVAEVALSLVLTAGTGLLLRSFWNLTRVDAGFDPRGVLAAAVELPEKRYPEAPQQAAVITEAVARLSRLPGVAAAGAISWLPLGPGSRTDFRLLDRPAPPAGQEPGADVRFITPGLLKAMGIPLLAGRDFTDADAAGHPKVVLVNRALAQQYWPGQDPLGKRVAMDWFDDHEAEVVGVVADVRLNTLDEPAYPTLYWSNAQIPNSFMTLAVRTGGPPEALAGAMRSQIAALDPELPLGSMQTLEAVVAGSLERQRFLLQLLATFAIVALALAMVGVYGVMSYTVVERVPEVGVRLAVGARPGDIVKLVLRDGLLLGAIGVGIGLTVAAVLGGLLKDLVFEVAPRDPLSLSAVAALLLAATLFAAWLPARRAGRVDPARALRAE